MIRPDLSLPIPETISSAHFIGIGGSGMSGLAKMFLDAGIRVSGSDRRGRVQTLLSVADGVRHIQSRDAECGDLADGRGPRTGDDEVGQRERQVHAVDVAAERVAGNPRVGEVAALPRHMQQLPPRGEHVAPRIGQRLIQTLCAQGSAEDEQHGSCRVQTEVLGRLGAGGRPIELDDLAP